jgi:hypothetical protein
MPSVTIDLTAVPSAAPAVTQALEQRLGASGQLELDSRHLHNFCHFLEAFHVNNAIDEITDSHPTTLRSSRELL